MKNLIVKSSSKDESLRNRVLKYADRHGTQAAATRFDVPRQRVAAWKAHRTMGTYAN